MTDFTVHTAGSVVIDNDPRTIKPNQLTYAKDNELFGDTQGGDMSYSALPSSSEAFTLPSVPTQFQYVRIKFDPAATTYNFNFKDVNGNAIGAGTVTIVVNPLWTKTDFVSAINTAINPFGYTASFDNSPVPTGFWFPFTIYLTSGSTPIEFSARQFETISGETSELEVYTLQDAFNPLGATSGQLQLIKSVQLQKYLFILSKSLDNEAFGFGYATPNQSGVWTYTSLILSNKLTVSDSQPIDFKAEEIANNQFAFYWTDNTEKPKVLYVPIDLSSPLKYNMTDYETSTQGQQSLESIAEQTNLQIQNPAIVQFSEQLESGGSLSSGTWFYFVQVGMNQNYSEWSPASEGIPVFTEGTSGGAQGAEVRGDKTPATTSKINKIFIDGVDPRVYNSVRVAALLNQGGAFTAQIIGEYSPTILDFFIEHTGNEVTEDIDFRSLPPVQEVILQSKSLEIKKNRLNLFNNVVAVDGELDDVFSGVTLGQDREALDSTGKVSFVQDPIFRVGLNADYWTGSGGEQTITFDNDSTNGFFDTGSFNLATREFTVPSTGDYTLTINLYTQTVQSEGNFYGVRSFYVINTTNGDKYCVGEISQSDIASNLTQNKTISQTVTLTAGHVLVFKYIAVNDTTGSTAYGILAGDGRLNSTSFSASRAVTAFPSKSLTVGEYQLPENVATKVGYMVNEQYAFFARVHYTNGYVSSWRYIGNYSFGDGSQFAFIDNAALTTTGGTFDTYSYFLTVNGIDVSSIKDEARWIEIGRAICNPTILGTGIFIPSHGNIGSDVYGGGFKTGLYTANTNTATSYGNAISNTSDFRLFGVIVCPDWIASNEKPQFQQGDYIVAYGQPQILSSIKGLVGGGNKFGGVTDMNGVYIPNTNISPTTYDIEDGAYSGFNINSPILSNTPLSKYLYAAKVNDGSFDTLAVEGMAITLDSKIIPNAGTGSGNDQGLYYVQYVRPISNQYDLENVRIVSCNHFIEINPSVSDILPQQNVFGGDTYTQKTYVKVLYNARNPDATNSGTLTSFIGMYSQNKINQQLRFVEGTDNKPFPLGNNLSDYLFSTYTAQEQFNIDAGYTWYLPLLNGVPYNPKYPQQSKYLSRIWYSENKPIGSLQDWYRTILPNNFKDLSAKDGEGVALIDTNDVMIAIQPYAVSTLPYQSDVALSSADGSIYIGNGGVYAQRENKVSTYGSSYKSAVLAAENLAGNTQVYWYSDTAKALMRYGNDGIRSLSNQDGWRTWFLNAANFISGEFDIVMGYDRNRRLIFVTARAVNEAVPAWNNATTYNLNDYVRYTPTNPNNYQNFEQLPDIYRALSTNTNTTPHNNPAVWQYISTENLDYYNYWTAMYNENMNGFQGYFSLLPSRYEIFDGKPMCRRVVAPLNIVYDLFGGTGVLQWMDSSGVFKQGSFELEWVATKQGLTPNRIKSLALQVGMNHNVSNNPTLIVSTENQESTMASTDFDFRQGLLGVGVFPDHDDEPLIGEYFKIKLTSTLGYRIYSLVSHFYQRARNIFS